MMKLKKVPLINWLYYEKTILSSGDIVFLSGKTGEGESALIDAMQPAILGRINNPIFSRSAGDKITRDLVGYLKGKYRDDTFKRNEGTFSSHLCMEFEDKQYRIYCFGTVFDVNRPMRGDTEYCYHTVDQPIPGHYFTDEGMVFDIRRMKRLLASFQDHDYRSLTTHTDYRDYFRRRMLIKDQRFFNTLKMVVAYAPMTSISEFIVENVCQGEEDSNLGEMREETQDYRQMREQLETAQQKKAQLSLIHEQYTDICEEQERVTDLRVEQKAVIYYGILVEYDEAVAQYEVYTKGYQRLTEESRETEEQRALLEQSTETSRDTHRDNATDILGRKIQAHLEQRSTLQRDTTAVQQQLVMKGKFLKEQIEQLEEIEDYDGLQLGNLDLSGVRLSIQRSVHAAQWLAAFDLDVYGDTQRRMRDIESTPSTMCQTMQSSLQTCREEQGVLVANRRAPEARKKTYPKGLPVLKRELEGRPYRQVGKLIEVCIPADLFSTQEEARTNAIGSYIRNQKLSLTVETEYFMDAYCIYRSIRGEKKIHTYSIADITKAKPGKRPDVKTLYNCVRAEREDVRPYVEYLLGRVVCCEAGETLRNCPISITSDCVLHSGYAVSHTNPELYKVSFIGADPIGKQLQESVTCQQKLTSTCHKLETATRMLQAVQL